MGRLARGMVLPLPQTTGTVALHWQLQHGKLLVWCTHILCISFRNLRKKVALQPYICMGGPTLGLTCGPPCHILIRQGNGISGWPKDMPS